MNWQKISIERLREYEARKLSVSLISEQIRTLYQTYTALRSAAVDAIPVQESGGNRREDALINNIAMREELKHNLAIAEREVKITEKGLAKLTDEQQKILYRFYICRSRRHVESLCEELCFEKTKVYTLKEEALKKFTLACYGVVEI